MNRRRLVWSAAIVLGVSAAVGAGVGTTLLIHDSKRIDPAWQPCGLGNRLPRGIAVTGDDGGMFVAANEPTRGDVWVTHDQCASFTPLGLTSAEVLGVSWLPRAGSLCAGTREGLFCLVGGNLRGPLSTADVGAVHFAMETRDGVVAGAAASLLFGKADLRELLPVAHVEHASTSAVVTDWATLVAGPTLMASLDGGRSFLPVPAADFEPRALAAHGARVYAVGGRFEGFIAWSDNGGQHWDQMPAPNSTPRVLLLPPRRPDLLFLGTHGALFPGDAYLSLDGGNRWRALGCPASVVTTITIDEVNLYCGGHVPGGEDGLWRIPLTAVGLAGAGEAI